MIHYLCIFQGHGLPAFIHILKGRIELKMQIGQKTKEFADIYICCLALFGCSIGIEFFSKKNLRCTFALNLSSALFWLFTNVEQKKEKS